MKTVATLCSVLAFLWTIAAPCSASMIDEGGQVGGHSWSQQFQENGTYHGGTGSVDLLAVKIFLDGDDSFESPTFSSFSDSSWSLLYENSSPNPTIASAGGTAVTPPPAFQFTLKFAGNNPSSNPLKYSYVAYDGDTLRGGGTCSWDGNHWTCTEGPYPLDWAPTRPEVVPEPGTFALLIVGGFSAVATVWIRRRRGME